MHINKIYPHSVRKRQDCITLLFYVWNKHIHKYVHSMRLYEHNIFSV